MENTVEKPEVTPPVTPTEAPATSSAGIIVLQWLTYAFWGWLILGLIWLMIVILVNAILGESVSDVVPYAIAASLVLLPLAFVSDHFYRKYEPSRKTGGAMVIMVIHAVLFAVLGIISLIIAVFTGLNAAINSTSGNTDAQLVVILTALFATVLYAAAFLRTLNPFKGKNGKKVPAIYGFSMLGLTVLLLIFAIVGPVVQSVAARGDRLIEQHLPEVQTAVNDYIRENDKLPASLNDITLYDDEAKQLISDNKVEYINEGTTTEDSLIRGKTTHRYQLCVDYQYPSKQRTSYYQERGYSSYLSTYGHGDGRQCYKLQEVSYER